MPAGISARRLVALLDITSVDGGDAPRYRGLAVAVRTLIVDGRLLPGWRMPSERDLAAASGLSRNTVSHAYELLREWGYQASVRGSGSTVRLPQDMPGPLGSMRPGHPPPADGTGPIDLTRACPQAAPEVADAYREALAPLPPYLAGSGYEAAGLPVLREAVARRYDARGLPTDPAQIVITNGALAGLAVLGRAFVGPGDRVVVENPGYPTAVATFRRGGARMVGVAVGDHGVEPADLASVVRQTAPRVALLTPDFQNPTGALTSAGQRAALGAVLARDRVLTVIDETLVEVVLEPREAVPPPYAACVASDADVITVGSMSKSHWGGLRIGWLRVPTGHVGTVVAARTTLDLGAPVLEQLAAAWLLERQPGPTAAMTELTRARRDALAAALAAACPDWSFRLPGGGLSLWCRMPTEAAPALAAAAEADGVLVVPGPVFSVDGLGLHRYVRLPYAASEDVLVEAARRLGAAWSRVGDRGAALAPALVT